MFYFAIQPNGSLELEEGGGSFTPMGYAPQCPNCKGRKTMYSALLYLRLGDDWGWMCTECGDTFTLEWR